MGKRLWGAILALCMILTLFPAAVVFAEELSPKKDIEAVKSAISAAMYTFDASNDTTEADLMAMAKEAMPAGSKVTFTIRDFELVKATTKASGIVRAVFDLKCDTLTSSCPVGKSIPKLVTADSSGIEEDKAAMSAAMHAMTFTNKITKEEMLAVALAAAKNGSTAVWQDNFQKRNATFKENGKILGYLTIRLNGETRELRFQEEIPMLIRKMPTDKISVNKEEWEILRLTNVERAKEGTLVLTMVSPLQEACDIREKELVVSYCHTRPDGTECYTAIPKSFQYVGAGENITQCTVEMTAEIAMNNWMNSPPHRANLLKASHDYMGAGTYQSEGVQMFADWSGPIVSCTTSAGTFQFEDEEAMLKEYLICTTTDGVESYMPLDTAYMTRKDGGFVPNIRMANPPVLTVGEGGGTSAASVFTDVAASAYYADAVSWAVEKGITAGTSATTFSPDDTCTRAQILTFLWRAVGSPKSSVENPFRDVKADDYYYDAAVWASEKGMVTGDIFAADAPCTRASTVTYLWQNAGSPEGKLLSRFTDVPVTSDYAQAVNWAVQNGVTSGTSKTTFSPDDTCTRGQIVTFLNRALK